jgi:hypothetical protein
MELPGLGAATKDGLTMTGKLKIEINGEVVREIDNLVVTVGKTWVAARMVAAAVAVMSHMAVGTTNTTAVVGDTALAAESARVALTSGTSSGAVATYVATFPAGTGTGAIVEAGILNAVSAGTLLCRTVFSVINKGAADAMTITWTVTVS